MRTFKTSPSQPTIASRDELGTTLTGMTVRGVIASSMVRVRIMRPLGFYRAQAWVAFYWGVEGGGWWTYHGDDLWDTHPAGEPEFGGVASDGRDLVTTRRWEAMRDGIEDFNVLCLLRDGATEHGDAAALRLLDQAVGYVFHRSWTGLPREAKVYELDFDKLTRYRGDIRAALERLYR